MVSKNQRPNDKEEMKNIYIKLDTKSLNDHKAFYLFTFFNLDEGCSLYIFDRPKAYFFIAIWEVTNPNIKWYPWKISFVNVNKRKDIEHLFFKIYYTHLSFKKEMILSATEGETEEKTELLAQTTVVTPVTKLQGKKTFLRVRKYT